jgi:endonuclease YncB( thermonuclease family)
MRRRNSRRSRRVLVQSVVDGDSLRVKYAGFFSFMRRPYPVRLYAVDSPELAQPYGAEARDELASLVRRGRINMEAIATDRYGRTVGLLYRSRRGRQQSVNLMMVRSGMAYWYRRYGGRELGFPEAEEDAKRRRRGVWRDDRGRQHPWEYRADIRRARRRRGRWRRLLIWSLALAVAVAAAVAVAWAMGMWG